MSLFDVLAGAGSLVEGDKLAKDLRATGTQGAADMEVLAKQLAGDAAFKGYGVTTGLGTSTVGTDGSMNLGVGQDPQMLQWMQSMFGQGNQFNQYAQQAAGNSMMDTGAREQDIYNRTLAMQQPGLDAQRAQMLGREQAMGRGGVRGSQFGGSGEDAAMARAQFGAQNQASFASMSQAQNEMMNQGQLASQFGQLGQGYGTQGLGAYGQSFMPMEQQLQAMQVAGQDADRSQTGQLTGTGYGAQLGLGGLQAQINADSSAAQIWADMFGDSMTALGGLDPNGEGLWETIKTWW
tara:strand:- start:2355 stop:3233 length:879 start_codon:yes stop_codon:yes gene_type:complete